LPKVWEGSESEPRPHATPNPSGTTTSSVVWIQDGITIAAGSWFADGSIVHLLALMEADGLEA
jgi:hypothetical protein